MQRDLLPSTIRLPSASNDVLYTIGGFDKEQLDDFGKRHHLTRSEFVWLFLGWARVSNAEARITIIAGLSSKKVVNLVHYRLSQMIQCRANLQCRDLVLDLGALEGVCKHERGVLLRLVT